MGDEPTPPDVLHLWHPLPELVEAARYLGATAKFSYDEVGATRDVLPPGYDYDEQSTVIGHGDLAFARARAAVIAGRMFDIPWITLDRDHLDLHVGTPIPFVSRQFGMYALNVCRIVYVIDEPDTFAFAWGTVTGHVIAGEERFGVQQADNGDVLFAIRKFSRPAHPLTWLARPLARRVQRRFTRDALAAMVAALAH